MSTVRIETAHGCADIHSACAMIGPVRFRPDLTQPREIEPFFVAPW
jgi:hypothetical protein